MSAGMPELGSKISLISKADIRYEGRLFTVDPKECTIALASVRSFGTEDRETPYPVPAQSQVYDYILFRGSDIKDIRVVNNVTQPLNDPAIMQLSVPPTLGQQQFQNHPMLGHMGHVGQFPSGYGAMAGSMAGLSGGMVPGIGGSMQRAPRSGLTISGNKPNELIIPGPDQQSILSSSVIEPPRPNDHDIIGGASRSTTPASLGSRKSPTNDQGVQAGGKQDKKPMKPIQPPGHQRSNNNNNHHQQRRGGSQERRNSRGDGQDYHQRNQNRQQINRNHNMSSGGQQQHHHHHPPHQSQQHHQQHHHQHQNNQGNHHHQQQMQRGGWVNRGPIRQRGRPRGGSGGVGGGGSSGGGGGYKPNAQGQPNQGNKKNTLKFDIDYDFEQANTEFEELRSQLAKVKIDEKSTEVNGDIDKKDDSGNETGAGENEPEEEHEVFYDKSKSFFDKISCEAVERAKGKSQRTDWRTERKLNSETFGVAATRRGNYRGRGGFRGGMGYRGGYRGGYNRPPQRRDQGGNRSGPNQQNDQHHHQQQQQQQQQQPQPQQKNNQASALVPATAGGK